MESEISLGRWIKQRRDTLGLTQEQLAHQVGCAVETVRKLEAGKRRPSHQMAQRLAEHLLIAPDEQATFIQWARALHNEHATQALPWHTPSQPTNVPTTLTPLLGRTGDVAAIQALLGRADVRLVTLLGPPGVGKTRLGLAVAEILRDQFRDGVWWVALAPVSYSGPVVPTIAQTLAVKQGADQSLIAALKTYLHSRHLLLLLDNIEHIVAAAPCIVDLLMAAPGLKVLVTSRVPLHVSGEHEYSVAPLAVPDPNYVPSIEQLQAYAAVALFMQRAQAIKAEFAATMENAQSIVEICRRLDGLPLAIELAAARVKLFTPHMLLARLNNALTLLTGGARDLPPRQRTLRSAIEWSYRLLGEDEQRLFRRLGVFVDGCTIEAAAAVCHADGAFDLIDGLSVLLDNSLLRQEQGSDGEPRFTMLETIREYAAEQLAVSEEATAVRDHHAQYYLMLAEQVQPLLERAGVGHKIWLERLDQAHDNVRTALQWSVEQQRDDLIVRYGDALRLFWLERGHYTEGRRWLTAALGVKPPLCDNIWARMLETAGLLAKLQADYACAARLLQESRTLCQTLGDEARLASVLMELGGLAILQGNSITGQDVYMESLALWRRIGDQQQVAHLLHRIGVVAFWDLNFAAAAAHLKEALLLERKIGDFVMMCVTLRGLGDVALEQGDDQAPARLEHALTATRQVGNAMTLVGALGSLGYALLVHGNYQRATALLDEAEALARSAGMMFDLYYNRIHRARAAYEQGDEEQAVLQWTESLTLAQKLNPRYVLGSVEGAAIASAIREQPVRAARLFGAAEALREAWRQPRFPSECSFYERALARARAGADPDLWFTVWAAGRAMTFVEAVAFAQEELQERAAGV